MEDVLKYFIQSYFMDQPLYRITICLHLYRTYYRRKTINYELYIISAVLVYFIVYGLINAIPSRAQSSSLLSS